MGGSALALTVHSTQSGGGPLFWRSAQKETGRLFPCAGFVCGSALNCQRGHLVESNAEAGCFLRSPAEGSGHSAGEAAWYIGDGAAVAKRSPSTAWPQTALHEAVPGGSAAEIAHPQAARGWEPCWPRPAEPGQKPELNNRERWLQAPSSSVPAAVSGAKQKGSGSV